jgi:4-carboxymuconolactone decarboxylase
MTEGDTQVADNNEPKEETMSKSEMPEHFLSIQERFPDIAGSLDNLRGTIRQAGPLDVKTTHLIQVAAAAGIQSHGALHSHVRQALEAGATREEVYHSVLLLITTIGFPRVAAAINWIDEVIT